MGNKVEELIESIENLQHKVKDLETRLQKISRLLLITGSEHEGPEEPVTIEISNTITKWFNDVKQEVIVIASRDKHGLSITTSTLKELAQLPLDRVVFRLVPFSNEQRLKILLLLDEYPKSSTDLSNATGLQGGQLYHHLDELIGAQYVEKEYKGKYRLTEGGRSALYSALLISKHSVTTPKMEHEKSESGDKGETPVQ